LPKLVLSSSSNLAKGWISLQDAKREILGKPKAGVKKYAIERPKRVRRQAAPEPICDFSETLEGVAAVL
jgi:hypothetical protein